MSRSTDMQIESEPTGAQATTSLGSSCRTPCALPIQPSHDFTVTYSLDGYQPQTIPVKVIRTYAMPDREGRTRADPEIKPNPARAVLLVPPPPEPKRPGKKKPRAAAKLATSKPAD